MPIIYLNNIHNTVYNNVCLCLFIHTTIALLFKLTGMLSVGGETREFDTTQTEYGANY